MTNPWLCNKTNDQLVPFQWARCHNVVYFLLKFTTELLNVVVKQWKEMCYCNNITVIRYSPVAACEGSFTQELKRRRKRNLPLTCDAFMCAICLDKIPQKPHSRWHRLVFPFLLGVNEPKDHVKRIWSYWNYCELLCHRSCAFSPLLAAFTCAGLLSFSCKV